RRGLRLSNNFIYLSTPRPPLRSELALLRPKLDSYAGVWCPCWLGFYSRAINSHSLRYSVRSIPFARYGGTPEQRSSTQPPRRRSQELYRRSVPALTPSLLQQSRARSQKCTTAAAVCIGIASNAEAWRSDRTLRRAARREPVWAK